MWLELLRFWVWTAWRCWTSGCHRVVEGMSPAGANDSEQGEASAEAVAANVGS